MDLQTEYTSRHKFDVVVGTPGSYLLFKIKDNLYCALIGHKPRIINYCEHCKFNNMALEIISISKNGMIILSHTHINPDEDIKSAIKNIFEIENIEIIRYQNETQIESLVWKTITGKKGDYVTELFECLRNPNPLMCVFSQCMRVITYRRHPLVFDGIKDT